KAAHAAAAFPVACHRHTALRKDWPLVYRPGRKQRRAGILLAYYSALLRLLDFHAIEPLASARMQAIANHGSGANAALFHRVINKVCGQDTRVFIPVICQERIDLWLRSIDHALRLNMNVAHALLSFLLW